MQKIIKTRASAIMTGKYINRIGSFIQLDLDYYIRNSFYLIMARGALMACGLLLSVTFARLVSQESYGQWNYVFSIIGICAILTLPGMGTAITQAVATGHGRVLIDGTRHRLRWSMLGSLALAGVGLYYLLAGTAELGKGLLVAAIFLPFYQSFDGYAAYITGKKQFDRLAKYQIITQVAAILITVLVIYLSRNLVIIITAYLVSFTALKGYFFRTTSREAASHKSDPSAITFGNRMTIAYIPAMVRDQYDKIIIALFLSFTDLAIYSIALAFSEILSPLRSIIASLVFPKLSQMNREQAYSEVRKRWPLVIAGFAVIGGVLIALCPYAIPLLYSQKYAASVLYAQLLIVSVVISALDLIISKALFPSQRRVKDLYKLQISSSVMGIILVTVLVINYGLMGAVIALILTRGFSLVYSLWLAGFLSPRKG